MYHIIIRYHPEVSDGNTLVHLGFQSSYRCLFQPSVIVPHAHWEAYGRGGLPLHILVSDSANALTVCQIRYHAIVGSS